jgi:hypothetical protein
MSNFKESLEPKDDDFVEEPDYDDTVKCCPNCETPNQFGELCHRCLQEEAKTSITNHTE